MYKKYTRLVTPEKWYLVIDEEDGIVRFASKIYNVALKYFREHFCFNKNLHISEEKYYKER